MRQPDKTKPSYVLVVGECRLRAWRKLEEGPEELSAKYKKGIPARLITELSGDELFDVEFEENYRRRALSWQDESLAFNEHYNRQQAIYDADRSAAISTGGEQAADPENWPEELSFAYGAGRIGASTRHYRRMVIVGRKVLSGDKEVLACESARAAGALLDRRMKRVAEIELATFGEIEEEVGLDLSSPSNGELEDLEVELGGDGVPQKARYYICHSSFNDFIAGFEGPRFNFVHCDFPYGKGLHESDLYNTDTKDMAYEDTPEIYWKLCHSLSAAQDAGVLSASCHIMFWFPMNLYHQTVVFFEMRGFRVEPYPLVWIKSDKMGIIPDPTRGPRRIYETAFIMSLGDRKVVRSTVNGAWYSSGRRSDALHASYKPTEMLADFFRMFVDSDSVVLDPTCGSGGALEVALLQHCKFAVGLDIDETCVEHSEERAKAAQEQLIRGA